MPDNFARNKGRSKNYSLDAGGSVTEPGPFIGEVMNNVDPTRSGRLQVYISKFSSLSKNDPASWRTVSYLTPFYGKTVHSGTDRGTGTSPGNSHTYGMWFTPPDIGVEVLCFFVNGDPNYGYYVGCVPTPGLNHMIPGIAKGGTEVNNKNPRMFEDPQFFDQEKPDHTSMQAVMHQQGLSKDTIRGLTSSSSQRESPSNVYGVSTPGRPIYDGGLHDNEIKQKLTSGEATLQDINIIGRRGGHALVMDDGDLEGNDQQIKIRTSKGHQITMSDDGDVLYIAHGNGRCWIELGKEGTVDVFSSDSVNVRTEGSLNLHADEDINMYAGKSINMKGKEAVAVETDNEMTFNSLGTIAYQSGSRYTIQSGGGYAVAAPRIDLNDGPDAPIAIESMPETTFTDIKYTDEWTPEGTIESIVTRAPTHEPYADHNGSVSDNNDQAKIDTNIVDILGNPKIEPPKY